MFLARVNQIIFLLYKSISKLIGFNFPLSVYFNGVSKSVLKMCVLKILSFFILLSIKSPVVIGAAS